MAQNATIFKAELAIADMDRHYYHTHALTIARHPSETDERMMVRLLAFGLNASESLAFTKGISTEDEPDLWEKDLTGAIVSWIDVGQPEERRVRKACNRAQRVCIYNYGGRGTDIWWEQLGKTAWSDNLSVFNVSPTSSKALAELAQRGMRLQFTIQDEQVWVADADRVVQVDIVARDRGGRTK